MLKAYQISYMNQRFTQLAKNGGTTDFTTMQTIAGLKCKSNNMTLENHLGFVTGDIKILFYNKDIWKKNTLGK